MDHHRIWINVEPRRPHSKGRQCTRIAGTFSYGSHPKQAPLFSVQADFRPWPGRARRRPSPPPLLRALLAQFARLPASLGRPATAASFLHRPAPLGRPSSGEPPRRVTLPLAPGGHKAPTPGPARSCRSPCGSAPVEGAGRLPVGRARLRSACTFESRAPCAASPIHQLSKRTARRLPIGSTRGTRGMRRIRPCLPVRLYGARRPAGSQRPAAARRPEAPV